MIPDLPVLFDPQIVPVFQTAADLSFKTSFHRAVEVLSSHCFGEVVLTGKAFRCVVVVDVTFAVTEFFHHACRRIEDVGWRSK